ncbi:MAG: YetF domain-containing protein [Clostridia bacterium]
MGLSFIRTIILYSCVICAMRIMGKRTIGEMNPTDMVVTIMISDLACVPMQSKSTPLWEGIIPIFTLVVMEVFFAFLNVKSRCIRRILVGRSCVVVKGGKLLSKEMEKLRVSVDDLEEQIRIQGYTDLSDVSEVILETSGKISVIPKESGKEVPYIIIADGKIRENELKKSGLSMDKIKGEMEKKNIKSLEDILYMSGINSRIVYMQKR